MNILTILELLGIISTFILGMLCYSASKKAPKNSVLLFWVGFNFLVISFVRILGFLGYIDLVQTRAIIGVFYPFILLIVLIDIRKACKNRLLKK